MSDDKVVQPFPRKADLPESLIEVNNRSLHFCTHPKLRIDGHDRTVTCAKCGATLDAFNYLLSQGVHLQQAWRNHDAVQRQVREVQERITALKKEEARLRARVKRLNDKDSAVSLDVRRPL